MNSMPCYTRQEDNADCLMHPLFNYQYCTLELCHKILHWWCRPRGKRTVFREFLTKQILYRIYKLDFFLFEPTILRIRVMHICNSYILKYAKEAGQNNMNHPYTVTIPPHTHNMTQFFSQILFFYISSIHNFISSSVPDALC